jgi:hypothetical protein
MGGQNIEIVDKFKVLEKKNLEMTTSRKFVNKLLNSSITR